ELFKCLEDMGRLRLDLEKSLRPILGTVASIERTMRPVTLTTIPRLAAIADSFRCAEMLVLQQETENFRRSLLEARVSQRELTAAVRLASNSDCWGGLALTSDNDRVKELEERVAALEALLTPPELSKEEDNRPLPGQYL